MAHAQVGTTPQEGLRDNTPRLHALIHATVVIAPGKVLRDANLVLRDGLIVSVDSNPPPADARVWDMTGKTIYPGFIDSYSRIGLPKSWRPLPERPPKNDENSDEKEPPPDPATGASHWNPKVTPERNAAEVLKFEKDEIEAARGLGFTAAWVVPGRGILRGTSAVINLSGAAPNASLLQPQAAQHVAFEISEGEGVYPTSLMGCIALIRQTLLDGQWQAAAEKNAAVGERPAANRSLDALAGPLSGKDTVVFETGDELDFLRVARIANEFRLQTAMLGNGYEYRMLGSLKKINAPLILPLNFAETPDVETPEKALDVSLAALEHWDLAPGNAARVEAAQIPFAFTSAGLHDPKKEFWTNLRLAVKRGLSEDAALAALTITPAKLTRLESSLGTIVQGKIANLTVASGDLFTDGDAVILGTWIDGKNFETDAARRIDLRGGWKLTFSHPAPAAVDLTIEGTAESPTAKLHEEALTIASDGKELVILGSNKVFGLAGEGILRLGGLVGNENATGVAQLSDGAEITWTLARTKPFIPKKEEKKPDLRDVGESIPEVYPAGEYGRSAPPPQPTVLLRNATIWTSGPDGRLNNTDLLIEHGKISKIGKSLVAPPNAQIIPGEGCHVTPGIVDCHSHTAINGGVNERGSAVNEASSAVTSEVRVGDVIDATDIALYHQLASGVTTINQLHGSANPIGGQNSVIKLRWGGLPDDFRCEGAMPGIKFALGENVKQSNWGDKFTSRYPQTRMGVFQILRDTFLAARDYEKQLAEGKKNNRPVRRDLRLETVLEILNQKRVIHIHSYRQDEVLAFIRLAQEFKFTVATFQHILEGYKVADEIAKLGAGASCFADWWGYKFEVYDAIPTNGAILHEAGVLTSFNSDSNELARRLNVEAAKAVKYGGLSEEEALKFVTINPARQLGIGDHTGSLETGKDADFVIWNGSPLSTYSAVLQTWIEGRKYFDHESDREQQKQDNALREKLIQKALAIRLSDGEKDKPDKEDGAADAEEPSFRALLNQQNRLHWWAEFRSLYHNGGDRHNCTNLAHQWR